MSKQSVREVCSCGASITTVLDFGYESQVLEKWRAQHRHEFRPVAETVFGEVTELNTEPPAGRPDTGGASS